MGLFEHPVLLIVIAIASIPIYGCFASMLFGERLSGFGEAVRFILTPDIVSMFRGEYWEDQWESIKFYAFIALCIAWVAAAYKVIIQIFT